MKTAAHNVIDSFFSFPSRRRVRGLMEVKVFPPRDRAERLGKQISHAHQIVSVSFSNVDPIDSRSES